jgi:DNA-binding response OmpR family regulator
MNSPVPLLLIEDNPGDARLIRDMLLGSSDGEFTLNVAGSLRDALRQVKEAPYEVILLDLSLPDSMGIDSLLKARAGFPDAAIIVLTGLDDQRVGVQAVQMGAQDYLVKDDVDAKLLRRCSLRD